MDAGQIIGRGIAFPPRVGADGRIVWSEGEANVREAIEIVLRTDLGERVRLPDFGAGLTRSLYEANTTATRSDIKDAIVRALGIWEPRISVESVDVDVDVDDPEAVIATIAYQLVATGSRERVSLTVLLA